MRNDKGYFTLVKDNLEQIVKDAIYSRNLEVLLSIFSIIVIIVFIFNQLWAASMAFALMLAYCIFYAISEHKFIKKMQLLIKELGVCIERM